MSLASVATMTVTDQRDSLSTSSFGICNLRTPFLIAPHQNPLDYCLSYCNSQTPFAHYRFDTKNWQNKSSQNTLLTKSKNIKNHPRWLYTYQHYILELLTFSTPLKQFQNNLSPCVPYSSHNSSFYKAPPIFSIIAWLSP